MYEFTVLMALADFVPVILFAAAAYLMIRDLHPVMKAGSFSMLSSGQIFVFTAGALKAVWKLLYALGICDFNVLNKMFLPTQSVGFLLAGVGALMLAATSEKKKDSITLRENVIPVFGGSILFLSMMVVGLGLECICLSIYACRKKAKGAWILFILSFVASMGMGYAGSLDPTLSWVNWMEEGINTLSQGFLLGGMILLDKKIGPKQ